MENAPLNLAHFHERRAEKHLLHRRYDEAIKCLEKSLKYIEEAYQTVQIPKALEVIAIQEREYKRQIQQILYKKSYYESIKAASEETPSKDGSQNEDLSEQTLQDSSELEKTINKTMENYDVRYNLTLINKQELSNENTSNSSGSADRISIGSGKTNIRTTAGLLDTERDNLLDLNLELEMREIPTLAPLELPKFDYEVLGRASSSLISTPKSGIKTGKNDFSS